MRIITRYMAGRFIKPFLFGLGLFALLIFLGDMFDRMNYLVKSKAPLGLIIEYLWLEVPYWTIRVIPMATLLGTLFAITGFIRSGEWIGFQAAGFEPKDLWAPILWCSLVVAVLSFVAQETILPRCYSRAKELWHESIHPEWEWDKYHDLAVIGKKGQFIQAELFRPKLGHMKRPIIEIIGPNGVEKQWDAQAAVWDGVKNRWILTDGVERTFKAGKVQEKKFKSRVSDIDVPPRKLIPRTKSPDEMSLLEIIRYGDRVRHLGGSLREFQVAAHAKLAYPFTNLIICALGIPVAMRLRRAPKALSFLAALVVSFGFLWCMEIGRALGNGGKLHPAVAAWAANIVFGILAVVLLSRDRSQV